MKQTIGKLLLSFWIPTILALAFPEMEDGMYIIAGLIMMVFGTWGGILLVQDKK